MERAGIKMAVAVAVALSILSVAAGAGLPFTTAPPIGGGGGGGMSFQQCYVGCFVLCAIQPTQTLSSCGFQCLRDCLIPQTDIAGAGRRGTVATAFHFCNLGCASTHCTNLSTLNNPGGKEVAGCVGSCSGMCTNNYRASSP